MTRGTDDLAVQLRDRRPRMGLRAIRAGEMVRQARNHPDSPADRRIRRLGRTQRRARQPPRGILVNRSAPVSVYSTRHSDGVALTLMRKPTTRTCCRGRWTCWSCRRCGSGQAHGYTIARLIEQRSDAFLQVEQGSLYPALNRLEDRGWVGFLLGDVGEQPPRALLPPDSEGPPSAAAGERAVGAAGARPSAWSCGPWRIDDAAASSAAAVWTHERAREMQAHLDHARRRSDRRRLSARSRAARKRAAASAIPPPFARRSTT